MAKDTQIVQGMDEEIEKGSFVPCVLTRIDSSTKGEQLISGISMAKCDNGIGFFVELSDKNTSPEELKELLNNKLELMAKARKCHIVGKPQYAISEHEVQVNGCTTAAAVYIF